MNTSNWGQGVKKKLFEAIYVSGNWVSMGSDNAPLAVWCQVITWSNDALLWILYIVNTKFSKILQNHKNDFLKKLEMFSKNLPICSCFSVLNGKIYAAQILCRR